MAKQHNGKYHHPKLHRYHPAKRRLFTAQELKLSGVRKIVTQRTVVKINNPIIKHTELPRGVWAEHCLRTYKHNNETVYY